MKKFILNARHYFVLPALLALTLTACGESEPETSKNTTPSAQETQSTEQVKSTETKAKATNISLSEQDLQRMIGDPNAPVTMIEYASYTCPHCADFHTKVLPQIKKDFVDTGKVKVIFRDFPFERVGATAALLSTCVDPNRYHGFNDLLMKQQSQWAASPNPVGSLLKLAKLAGLSQEKIDSCLANEKLLDEIVAVRKEAMDKHGFNSTPSFLINDEKVVGGGEYARFKNIIESKLD